MADLRHAVITAKMTIVITRRSEMAGFFCLSHSIFPLHYCWLCFMCCIVTHRNFYPKHCFPKCFYSLQSWIVSNMFRFSNPKVPVPLAPPAAGGPLQVRPPGDKRGRAGAPAAPAEGVGILLGTAGGCQKHRTGEEHCQRYTVVAKSNFLL